VGYDWNDLKYFLACARAGSLAGAGRALKVDQTTVGRRLAALEESLGASLFERSPAGFVLTPTGERLVETARQVEQGAIDLERVASGADARLEGVVRVATTEMLAATILTGELLALRREHPGIELQLVTGVGSTNLLKREADVALRAGPRPTHQSLVARRLGAITWGLHGSAAYLERRKPVRAGRPLAGHDLIAFDDELANIPAARWLAERAAGARVVMRTNSMLCAAEAAGAGWGLAALPDFVGARAGLVRVAADAIAPNDLWLVVHPDLQHTGRVRAVLNHLARAVQRAGVLEPGASPSEGSTSPSA
jgi:DNA-binding transcriptional LysR family regulator